MLILVIVFAPLVVLTFLRANAAIVFLSLCLGSVLVRFVGDSASSFGNLFSASSAVNQHTLPLILLVLPVVFTTIFMIRSVRGGFRLFINIFPALAVGFVGLLLAVPLLAGGLRSSITQVSLWQTVESFQQLVVIVGAIISMLFLWMQRPKKPTKDKHEK